MAKHWDHDGVRCEISLQAAFVVASPLQEGAAEERVDIDLSASATEPATTSMRGQRVLVAEDELLLALDVAAQLRAVGCTVIGPAASLEEALHLVSTGSRLDAAVLDVNLHGQLCLPLAKVLSEKRVPIVYTTGYAALPDGVREGPGAVLLHKPIRQDDLVVALRRLLTTSASQQPLAETS